MKGGRTMPKATVGAIITSKDSGETKILLTRRGIEPFKGKWCLPGGHIDQNETAKQAVIREIKEETGLDFEGQPFGCFDEIFPELEHLAVVTVFEGTGIGTLKAQQGEVTQIIWFPVEEAMSFDLAYRHNEILKAYLERKINTDVRTEILQEFSALRDESVKRTEIRHQLLSFTLVAAGTFLTVGAQEIVEPSVLLIYPLLAAFLAATWTHSDIRVGEIGEYIRNNIEPRLEGLNWEVYLHEKYTKQESWLRRRLSELSASGIFLSTELLAVVLARFHSRWDLSQKTTKILLVLDVIAIVLTVFLIFCRRRKLRSVFAEKE
jgi:8-oxo-dGTP diphosphatase